MYYEYSICSVQVFSKHGLAQKIVIFNKNSKLYSNNS